MRYFIFCLTAIVISAGILTALIISGHILLSIVCALTLIWALAKAISLFRKNDRNISLLLDAVSNKDYTLKFVEKGDRKEITASLNRINAIISHMAKEAARKEKYYEKILDFIETGVIVVDESGHIYQHNPKALKLLGIEVLTHIKQLRQISADLPETFLKAESGLSYNIHIGGHAVVVIQISTIEIAGKNLRIFAMNEITNALEKQEAVAWQKLTRVLTHEIMNSLSPVVSISDMLLSVDDATPEEMREGLATIKTAGEGLLKFASTYRSVSAPPHPVAAMFPLKPMVERAATSFRSKPGNRCKVDASGCNPDLSLLADEHLIERVLTNLLNNAAEAGARHISISSDRRPDGRVSVRVSNDGKPVPRDIENNIFTPFFTTRQEGNGIGLSLCRQIMAASGGSINLIDRQPVTFELVFNTTPHRKAESQPTATESPIQHLLSN